MVVTRANRRLARVAAEVGRVAPAVTASGTAAFGSELEGVGSRMGGHLNELGRRSDDPANPTPDVGTVKLFENERIRVWDMCVVPGSDTSFHQHKHDYIFLQIGDGLCTTESVDPVTGEVSTSGSVSAVSARSCTWSTSSEETPKIHRLSNAHPTDNYRQILIEFLEDAPRHAPDEVAACLQNAASTTEVGSGLLFENERCRVHDFSLAPHSGEDLPLHHHTLPYFYVNTCGGQNLPGMGFHGLVYVRSEAEGGELILRVGGCYAKAVPFLPILLRPYQAILSLFYVAYTVGGTVQLWSQDRDMSFQDVPFGGYSEDGKTPVHQDKVWNNTDVPYSSFIVEIK